MQQNNIDIFSSCTLENGKYNLCPAFNQPFNENNPISVRFGRRERTGSCETHPCIWIYTRKQVETCAHALIPIWCMCPIQTLCIYIYNSFVVTIRACYCDTRSNGPCTNYWCVGNSTVWQFIWFACFVLHSNRPKLIYRAFIWFRFYKHTLVVV